MDLQKKIMASLESVPTLPTVVTRILEIVLDEGASARDAAKIVEADQSLASKVLKIINSPAYGLRQKVSTVTHAIAMLGFASLKNIVLSVSVFEGMMDGKRNFGFDKNLFWQHCLAAAVSARTMAKETEYDIPDEAYVAGLLHDIGKVILDQFERELSDRVVEILKGYNKPVVEVEREIYGVDHAQAGSWVAQRWHLPEILRDAIQHHHTEQEEIKLSRRNLQLVSLVKVADFICWTQGIGSVEARRPPWLERRLEEYIPLKQMENKVIEVIQQELERMAAAFNFTAPDAARFRQALQKANLELGRINSLYDEARRQLEKRVKELTEVNKAISKARQTLSVEGITQTITDAIQEGLGFDRAFFFIHDKQRNLLFPRAMKDSTNIQPDPKAFTFQMTADAPMIKRCTAESKAFRISTEDQEPTIVALIKALEVREAGAVPVVSKGELLGLIVVDNAFTNYHIQGVSLESLGILASEAAMAIENAQLFQKTHELAIKDDLTAVFNRRQTLQALAFEIERARRYQRPLSIAMCDLDYFKSFNDNYGHLSGDQLLQDMAKIIKGTSREVDIVGRYGGEEFLVILPETPLSNALLYAERVRKAIERYGVLKQQRHPKAKISISIGVAEYSTGTDFSKESIIARADKALYAAKERGRNRVCIAQ